MSETQRRTAKQASVAATAARQAWEKGQPIQCVSLDTGGPWVDCYIGEYEIPQFSDPKLLWRPKPGPSYRPWRGGEIPVGAMIRWRSATEGHHRYLIAYASEKVGIYKSTGLVKYDADFCLTTCEHSTDYGVTWKPCGILED